MSLESYYPNISHKQIVEFAGSIHLLYNDRIANHYANRILQYRDNYMIVTEQYKLLYDRLLIIQIQQYKNRHKD